MQKHEKELSRWKWEYQDATRGDEAPKPLWRIAMSTREGKLQVKPGNSIPDE